MLEKGQNLTVFGNRVLEKGQNVKVFGNRVLEKGQSVTVHMVQYDEE